MDLELPAGHMLRLSDEVLLIILKNLNTKDLLSVFWSCRKLQSICHEADLWTKIEDPLDNYETLALISKKLANPKTTKVRIVSPVSPLGNKGYRSSFCPSLIESLNLRTISPVNGTSSLTQLHLIRQKFNGLAFRLQMLPKSLKILHLSETHIDNLSEESQYFQGLADHFTSLEELDLSYCSWVTGHSLMSLSKFPKLTKLLLRGCRRVGECLAYVSLASRFGFKSLKILDVTDTKVGSSEFTGMSSIVTLEEFYFGQYDQYSDSEYNYINDFCFATIRNSQSLQVLDISGSRITNGVLPTLLSIPRLKQVYAHFTQLTQEAIEEFHRRKPNCTIYKVAQTVATPPPPIAHQQPFNYYNIRIGDMLDEAIELGI
ncbi:putative F-box/LRR-repeat protein C02F5.7 [Orchesella cincta]|uniref:Putative F-box/LRR-repeat protein C02F5.7 n=1 Tax=Orchesella cincta TaxID=48709 RepID=A0A1D2NJP0_ORCCI|nr:putative F-box/LRR-repeat protein C02F5.7 [Orchesella cincta]